GTARPDVYDGTARPTTIEAFHSCYLYISYENKGILEELNESARKLDVRLLPGTEQGNCSFNDSRAYGPRISSTYIEAKRIEIDSKTIDYRVVDKYFNHKVGWATANPYLPTDRGGNEYRGDIDFDVLHTMWTMDLIFLDAMNISGLEKISPTFNASEFPRPDIRHNFVLTSILPYAGCMWGAIVLLPMVFFAKDMIAEKEAGIKTYMMVMGMSPTAFYFAHFLTGAWKIGSISVICSIPLLVCLPNTFLFFLIVAVLFALNAVAFALLVATIFRRAVAVYGFIVLVWIALIVLSVTVKPDPMNVGMTVLSALNPTAAFVIGATEWTIYEGVDRFANPFGLLPTMATSGVAILMLILDLILLMIITLYLDAVFPSGDTPGKSPVFFISWIFRLCRSKDSNTLDEENLIASNYEENLEPETGLDPSQADVNVRSLVKKWPNGEVAVNGASMRAYRGQVTVLLGHNGAGKSSTFACLTGFSKPTGGQVLICGSNIAEDMKECQRFIGYCPQTNPLFAKLTCYEHLRLYGRFRAGKEVVTDEEIGKVLRDVGLADKRNTLASQLSGGMKRKLCVGMALVGQSRVVLLDEPTAGMDPGARFQIREILEKVKHDRTIVLTTHYMDEADALADRVAIMVKGEIVCNGSPEFLKKKFGTGYVLTVSLSATDNVDERVARVLNAVKAKIDGSKMDGSPGPQFNVLLPFDQKKKFADLFDEMESHKQALGIDSFGLSVNALEQVFIRVGELVEGGAERDSERARSIAEELCSSTEQKSSGPILLLLQFLVLLQRYFLYAWRHKIRTLIPFVVVILIFIPFMVKAYDSSSEPTVESGDHTNDIVINASQLVDSVLPVVVGGGGDPRRLASEAHEVAESAATNLVVKEYTGSGATKELIDDFLHAPPLGVGLGVDGQKLTAYYNKFLGLGWALSENFMVNAMAGKGKPDAITSGIKKDAKPEGQSGRRTRRSAGKGTLEWPLTGRNLDDIHTSG
ncbi:ABC transporter family protein, partial [Aphelenchoides avenae]